MKAELKPRNLYVNILSVDQEKCIMLKELICLADRLDAKGLRREADTIIERGWTGHPKPSWDQD